MRVQDVPARYNMELAAGKARVVRTLGSRDGAIASSKSQPYCLPCCHNGEDSKMARR